MSQVDAVSREELQAKLSQNGDVQVVNVLEPKYWGQGMIPGSKKIPLSQLTYRLGDLDRSKEVITYCANRNCNASRQAAAQAAEQNPTSAA